MADKLIQQLPVDQCLSKKDCLNRVFKQGTTYRIHFSQTLWHNNKGSGRKLSRWSCSITHRVDPHC